MASTSVAKLLKSTDGVEIYARATGDHSKPSLVFVHGLALSGSVFDGLFKDQDLLDKFYLVSYDMRGHGRSGKPNTVDDHASKLYADDFMIVVETFNLRQPVLIGWSLGSTVVCDICANLPSNSISGAVYAGGLPYVGPIIREVRSPLILGLLPGLFTTTDVPLFINTKFAFIDSLFNDPVNVPVEIKWSWLGSTIVQSPDVCQALCTRAQNPEKLFEAASNGLPLLVINGTRDTHSRGEVLVGILKEHFTNMEVCTIEDGSHAMFYDNKAEFVQAITSFANRVFRKHNEARRYYHHE